MREPLSSGAGKRLTVALYFARDNRLSTAAEASADARRLRRDIATDQYESRQGRNEEEHERSPVDPQVTLEVIGDKC